MAPRAPFDLKHFESITASMLNFLAINQAGLTDFNVGSVARTMLEAPAMEFEEQYYRLFAAIEKAIPISVFLAFDFELQSATPAVGTVTFARSTPAPIDYTIPAGTRVSTAEGIQFQTVADVTLETGETEVVAQIVATNPGTKGNVLAETIVILKQALLGIETVTNTLPTTGGEDEETEDARKVRFQEFISTLARTPDDGVIAGAKTAAIVDAGTGTVLEKVKRAVIDAPYEYDDSWPIGWIRLYIDNGSGTASSELVSRCQQVIDGYIDPDTQEPVMGYKAAGIVVDVLAATAVPVNITSALTLKLGADLATVETRVRAAIKSLFTQLEIGETLDWEVLLATIVKTEGVKTATVSVPSADVAAGIGQRLVPGTVSLS